MNINAINQTASMYGYKPNGMVKDSPVQAAALQQSLNQSEAPAELSPVQTVSAPAQPASTTTTTSQDLSSSLSQQRQAMASAAAGVSSRVSSNTSLPDLYQFDNKYLYGYGNNVWARIDTTGDGDWNQAELQAYADDYYKATGKTLDVDDLMDKYANSAGIIDYYGQKAMYEDDALGISYVKDEILRAEMGTSSGGGSSSSGVNWNALDSFVKDFTYGYPGKMYANIDHNEDGVWTLDEMMKYAKAYEKATGKDLDMEAMFAKYDRDGSGYLTYTEMNEMYRDDALGLSHIKDLLGSRESGSSTDKNTDTTSNKKDGSDKLYNTLMDMWGSKFSKSELRSLATAFNQGMQKAAMLDAFMTANSYINYGSFWNRGGGGTYTNWMASNISMLNMFVS